MFTKSAGYVFDLDPIREPLTERFYTTPAGRSKAGLLRMDSNRDPHVPNNPLGRNPGSVWRIAPTNYQGSHGATFPAELVRRLLLISCPDEGVVMDIFGGAGTAAMVALELGHRAITIDINHRYTAEAKNRLAHAVRPTGGEAVASDVRHHMLAADWLPMLPRRSMRRHGDVASNRTNGWKHGRGDHAGRHVQLFSVADINRLLLDPLQPAPIDRGCGVLSRRSGSRDRRVVRRLVMRPAVIDRIGALHQSSGGTILLDVLLDHAGVPDGIDQAWQAKHFLGAPVPGATIATVNLAHVMAAVEFLAEVTVEPPSDVAVRTGDELVADLAGGGSASEALERQAE